MHIRLTNGQPETYSIGQLRRDNPNTSFPKVPNDALLAKWGVYPYTMQYRPEYDQFTQMVNPAPLAQVNGVWTQGWEIVNLPVDQAKQNLIDALANKRWEVETGGITVGGIGVHTDRQSQSMITGAAVSAQINPDITVRWKATDGQFTTLNATAILNIASAVSLHVQACFDHEADLTAAITNAETVEGVAGLDINVGWP